MRVDWKETRRSLKEPGFDDEEIEKFKEEFKANPVKATLKFLDKKERLALNLYSNHLSIDAKVEKKGYKPLSPRESNQLNPQIPEVIRYCFKTSKESKGGKYGKT